MFYISIKITNMQPNHDAETIVLNLQKSGEGFSCQKAFQDRDRGSKMWAASEQF